MSVSTSAEQQHQHHHHHHAITLPHRYSSRKEVPRGRHSKSKLPFAGKVESACAYTLDEGEVECDLYFPNFARRGSEESRGRRHARHSSTASRLKEQMPTVSREEDDDDNSSDQDQSMSRKGQEPDDIFTLDNHVDDDEDEDDTEDRIQSLSKTMRRISNQSSSSTSTSTNDIGMVWDEEDHVRDDTIKAHSATAAATSMARQHSGSSYMQQSTSPKWTKNKQETVNLTQMPTLPFVRTMRRASENVMVPLHGYQWGGPRGPATTAVSRSNSVTSIHFDPSLAKANKLQASLYSASLSNPTTPQHARNQSVSDSSLLTAKNKESEDYLYRRKRSGTDPMVFSPLLDPYRMTNRKAASIKSRGNSKEHLQALAQPAH